MIFLTAIVFVMPSHDEHRQQDLLLSLSGTGHCRLFGPMRPYVLPHWTLVLMAHGFMADEEWSIEGL